MKGWLLTPVSPCFLTYCGPKTAYGDRHLGQHWLRLWRAAWRHYAIIWTNFDWASVRFRGIQLRTILQEIHMKHIPGMSLKITNIGSQSHLPWTNELTTFFMHYRSLPNWMEPENYDAYRVSCIVPLQLSIFTVFPRIVWNTEITLSFLAIYHVYY